MEKPVLVTSRRDEVIKLREAGLTYAEIGRRLIDATHPQGITKERVRQILKGNSTAQKPTLNSKIMLKTGDVAYLLGVHINTVRRWSKRGILKSYRICPRGDRRFKRGDVESFLEECENE